MTDEHYFTESTSSADVRRRYEFAGPSGTIQMETASGVFASTGLDRGTAVLLDHARRRRVADPPAGSHLCDLGAGAGPIALWMAAAFPACTVHAVEVNDRARELCRTNALNNGLANVIVESPDEVDPEIMFHLLWSNPPIRIGKSALHELLEHWLPRLDPSGHADLVVGRNLGSDSLADWLSARNMPTQRVASAKGFRVLRVRTGPDRHAR